MAGPSDFKELPQVNFDDSLSLVLTHGDINVHNVKLGTDGKVWLLDWGLAGMYPQWFEYASIMAYDGKDPPRGCESLCSWYSTLCI